MIINNDNDNDNDKHKNYQRRTSDGGWINMKNKIDHCSVTNKKQNMKICVSKWPSDARSLGSGARAAARQGVKNENPGRGGGLGSGGGRSATKMSQIDSRLRLQMQGIILIGGKATGLFVEVI